MASNEKTPEPSAKDLTASLTKCFRSGQYSDLKIRSSGGRTYEVHKVVVCAQSPFFEKASNPNNTFKENVTGVIELGQDDPDAVDAMLEFMYNCEYRCPGESKDETTSSATDANANANTNSSTSTIYGGGLFSSGVLCGFPVDQLPHPPPAKQASLPAMLFHAQMYAMADLYCIPALAQYAQPQFETHVYELEGWKNEGFADVVETVYTTTPARNRGLRNLILRICGANYDALMAVPAFVAMRSDLSLFDNELAAALPDFRFPGVEAYRCPKCLEIFYVNRKRVEWCKKSVWSSRNSVYCNFCHFEVEPSDLKNLLVKKEWDAASE